MKQPIWVLQELTNVNRPYAEEIPTGTSACRFWVFDSFEKAKQEMRNLIRYYATDDNELFKKNGRIPEWEAYIEEQLADNDGEDFQSVPFLHQRWMAFQRCANALRDVLPPFLTGECDSVEDALTDDSWTNHKEEWKVYTDDDGEIVFSFADVECGEIPSIFMNNFKMTCPEKAYCFHIRKSDFFDCDSLLSIDLVCCETNETPKEEYSKTL